MNNVEKFESIEQKLNTSIEQELQNICAQTPIALPKANDPIAQHYIDKISGKYNVERSKMDTDNAIELLYIAYNTTPQERGEIRVGISGIMDALIATQQESERTMSKALRIAESIQGQIEDFHPDWLDVKASGDAEEIKAFVTSDLRELAEVIREKATEVQQDLNTISDKYDGIIDETKLVSNASEKALSASLADQAAMEKEINEANARREQLESLVSDLQERVAKFEKMARDYESRAETAEERAFVMSIVQAGAQIVSAALPAVAMAAGGPGSFLAASTMSTLNQTSAAQSSTAAQDSDTPATPDSNGAELRSQISEMEAKKSASDAKKREILAKIATLNKEKAALLAAANIEEEAETETTDLPETDNNSDQDEAAESETETKTVSDKVSAEVAAIDARIADARKELELENNNADTIGAALAGLNQSLNKLGEKLGEMSADQKDQAASLRQMQMQMLDKVEEYENEKRNQTAELVKIKALLKGNRSKEETIKLAVKSLNISLSALKRTKEIIQEIAFFFKSFADFMGQVSEQANLQVESIDRTAEKSTLRQNRLARVITTTDQFFVKQSAEWHAVTNISDKFCQNFADGWSKLNKLSGTYIKGEELSNYLVTASAKLDDIANQREQESANKVAYIHKVRSELEAKAS